LACEAVARGEALSLGPPCSGEWYLAIRPLS
jgi:hypothetical protein